MADSRLPRNLTTPDGVRLHLQAWPAAAPRGTVLLLHGLGEHAGRYGHVATALNAAGFCVLAFDQRGHGRSEGPRGDTPTATAWLDDVALVIDALRRAGEACPLVLLGHSLGGLVAARFVAGALESPPPVWSRGVDALVLSSPALAAALSLPQQLLLAAGGALLPHRATGNGLRSAWLSRDSAVAAAYDADPLVHDRITPALARFTLDGGEFVRRMAPRWATPTLLMWAGADRCVLPSGSEAFARAAPPAVVETHCFDGLAHEIFNEPERGEVLAVLCRWLGDRWPWSSG